MPSLSARYQEEVKRRLAARRVIKREQRQQERIDHAISRIEGHEQFWIQAILRAAKHSLYLSQFKNLTEQNLAYLLATGAHRRGHTFTEALMYTAFNMCGLSHLKEKPNARPKD